MYRERIFNSLAYFQATATNQGEPIRSVISESPDAVVVAWHVLPGQKILPHVHPHGQDTWMVIRGQGEYTINTRGVSQPITAGDIVIANTNEVHGVFNNGQEPLQIISVVSPAEAGYALLS
ncbi:cupin domain-containing protein [Parvibium lacunae]|uniref:Cupin domain-containing protein n=1 Tax=Parvibium lacunae TaxID=1888893 RepID=A0A368L8D7_9BURK|nr:cupin domain-containing protein [Parvibium lacunae]RCS59499.1 cupin domain-containing protein [Parvibium lacunae]